MLLVRGDFVSKEKVLQSLKKNTQEIKNYEPSHSLTADGISEEANIQRNTASQYLNEFVKDGEAIKIKSRPAFFFHMNIFSEKFFAPKEMVYNSFDELQTEEMEAFRSTQEDNVFSSIIGAQSSLRDVVEQIKSSAFYPGTGLPIMFYGDTGVGKSLLARKTYEFCLAQQLIEEDAPFLELNCAQYYHNQELLSSILFGYKKGAFTGANEDKKGLLEAADGGVLFLDECHRLSPESQEKLFTFIDNHIFYRIGDNNKVYQSKVRLIFATTEDIKQYFLRTFTRRIPINIKIPSLEDRTSQEKSEYIYHFFIQESQEINKNIVITPWIINRLGSLTFPDNVGELKNLIKIICANAYSKQSYQEHILINSEALDNQLLSRFLSINEIDHIKSHDVMITPSNQVKDFMQTKNKESALIKSIYKIFSRLFVQLDRREISESYLIQQLSREANTVIEMLVFEKNKEENHSLNLLQKTVKELVNFLESSLFVRIRGNSVVALTTYLYKRNKFFSSQPHLSEQEIKSINGFISNYLKMELKVLNTLLELVETKLDISLTEEEKILLVFYLKELDLEVKEPSTRAVILCHGFSTASSIADVVNRFMEQHFFDAFDMPFNVTLDKMEEFMIHYVNTHDCSKGLIILTDMGSLMLLSERLEDKVDGPLLVMNNVTTQQALFVAEMIKKNTDLEIIGEKITNGMPISYKITYPISKKTPLIITVCHTGLGAAQQLKHFLDSSLPEEIGYRVEAVDYQYLKKYGQNNSLFKQYEVQGIVGTANPEVEDINYISLEDLISGEGQEYINQLFSKVEDEKIRIDINDNLVRNLSIERLISAITILDVKRVIAYIDEVLDEIQRNLKVTLSNSKKAILYVHIAGLVERLIRNQDVQNYQTVSEGTERDENLKIIARALEVIEKAYSIGVSVSELNYLYDIIYDI